MKLPYFTALLSIFLCLSACGGDSSADAGFETATPDSARTAAPTNGNGEDPHKLIDQYEPPGRVVWQKPEMVIEKMGDLTDKTVADLGAGSGFFARRLAQQAKKVIALDIDEYMIRFMDSIKVVELKPEYQARFETRLATPTDSKLLPGEADIILVVNTYIYIKDRVKYLQQLLDVLPVGGKIIIVDFKKKRMPIRYPPVSVRLELFEVENELETAGFTHIVSDDQSLDYQYIVMAEK